MADRRRFPVLGRATIVVVALSLGALIVPGAGAAPSKQDVADARVKVAELRTRIEQQHAELDRISAQASGVSDQLLVAQDQLEDIQKRLLDTQKRLEAASSAYDAIVDRLNERAHQAYIDGPGTNLEFILGATSLTDLSDRITFLGAVQQSDADLATEVQNLKNQLEAAEAKQQKLQSKQRALVADQKAKLAELQASFDQQQSILDQIQADEREAADYAAKISRQYKQWLLSQLGPSTGKGLLKVCPVDQPRGFGDGFGAPRYAGGFHLHKGVDIAAPSGTPIRAPFDGTARASSNTLGGLAVYVTGASGYVYNAHLSAYSASSNGPVAAGEIIGYVGDTGDAQGGIPHDHFEYHPNVIPSPWPASAYGYSVIDDAINPYPLLVEACT